MAKSRLCPVCHTENGWKAYTRPGTKHAHELAPGDRFQFAHKAGTYRLVSLSTCSARYAEGTQATTQSMSLCTEVIP